MLSVSNHDSTLHYNVNSIRYTIFERDTMGDDRNFISQFQYDVLILDEGHCIKNHSSKRYSVCFHGSNYH